MKQDEQMNQFRARTTTSSIDRAQEKKRLDASHARVDQSTGERYSVVMMLQKCGRTTCNGFYQGKLFCFSPMKRDLLNNEVWSLVN